MSPTPPTLTRYAPAAGGRTIHYRKPGGAAANLALHHHPKPVADFYSPEEIKRVYYVEVERDAPGARRVIVFEHNAINRVFC